MVNESGKIWCLRLNGGKVNSSLDSDRVAPIFRGVPSLLGRTGNATADSAEALARKIAAIIAEKSIRDPIKSMPGAGARNGTRVTFRSRPASLNDSNFMDYPHYPYSGGTSLVVKKNVFGCFDEKFPPGISTTKHLKKTTKRILFFSKWSSLRSKFSSELLLFVFPIAIEAEEKPSLEI